MQILQTLERGSRWQNHVAVRMWRGYEDALKLYINVMISEWKRRGFVNNMNTYALPLWLGDIRLPHWLGDSRLHLSHRCNLVRKDRDFYGPLWPGVDSEAPYWWPVKMLTEEKQVRMERYWNGRTIIHNNNGLQNLLGNRQ
jgi:hypothetical protein